MRMRTKVGGSEACGAVCMQYHVLTTHTSNTPSFLPADQLEDRSSMSVYVWKTHELARERACHPEKKRTVLILYTGGTIGMMWSEKEGTYSTVHVNKRMEAYCHVHALHWGSGRVIFISTGQKSESVSLQKTISCGCVIGSIIYCCVIGPYH